jgi:phospholipid/cholesterol/gamma-HCH transport system substrate-binding protein
MAKDHNHWKLGLFVIAGLVTALAAVTVLGVLSSQRDVGLYVSYFDESVQGLEVGSPIKFRGVTIGTVGKIRIAPDHRHVEVESELGVDELTRLGLDIAKEHQRFGAPRRLEMTADLRLQLASAGLTGVKFLQLDFFDVKRFPPPVLPFKVPKNYIPTAPSMMKNLEESLNRMMNLLPDVIDQAASTLNKIDVIVSDVNNQQIPKRISSTFDKMDGLLGTARQAVIQLNTKGLSQNANETLYSVNRAAGELDEILTRIDQDDGLLTSLGRASDAVGDTLRNADGIGGRLIETLESVQASARSLRKLTEALEQDPDMLLKGRSPERKQ